MTTLLDTTEGRDETSRAGRWELLRAVGAVTMTAPPKGERVARSLGLDPLTSSQHTELFVLALPPFAGIHLGAEGKLGGEGSDRVAGLWRALGLAPHTEVDHLGSLLALYAELGEAEDNSTIERTRLRLHGREVLLWEHLWSWLPGYLDAAERTEARAASWARLTRHVLTREIRRSPGATALPLALRVAPGPLGAQGSLGELLDALTAPVRTGFILTARDLHHACQQRGLGLRRGERRLALRAMLEQDAPATLRWLHHHALEWEQLHRQRPAVVHDPGPWWAARAAHSATVLAGLSAHSSQ